MIKIIELCRVCGGKGKFFSEKCSSCHGHGGSILKLDKIIKESISINKTKFNEQENALLELYAAGFSQEEISKKFDLTLAKTLSIFYQIEKKLNS
jgi:DNA-binding NarL/FixJ family response regulator